jgi:hypothetical protein
MQIDEKFSSNNVAISFIGFREDLVLPFILKLINGGIKSFIFLESSDKPENAIKISEDLKKKVIDIMLEKKTKFEFVEVINIWSVEEYLKILYEKDLNLVINISAGPSTFASAATLFSIFRGALLFYNVHEYKGSSFFVKFDITALKNLFGADLDILDNIIIKAVCSGNITRSEITDLIIKTYGKISERAIAYRVKELTKKDILIEEGNKPIYYKVDPIVRYLIFSKCLI